MVVYLGLQLAPGRRPKRVWAALENAEASYLAAKAARDYSTAQSEINRLNRRCR